MAAFPAKKVKDSDFATVLRQCALLGERLTPEQFLRRLAAECRLKRTEDPGGGLINLASARHQAGLGARPARAVSTIWP
jgi:hypothetical protein